MPPTIPSVARLLVQQIAADLEANAGLTTPHGLVRWRRPRAILPKECPLLVVWLDEKALTPIESSSFDGTAIVGISWHEATVEQARLLIDDEAKATSLLDNLERIEWRVRSMAPGGIVTIGASWQVRPLFVRYERVPEQQALTEGYALAVECKIVESA